MNDEMAATYVKRRTIDIQTKEYGMWVKVTPEIFSQSENLDHVADMFAHNIGTIGWRMTVPVHHLMSYMKPSDWWQHCRERWFPKWWLKRWPVQYDKVELDQLLDEAIPHGHSVFTVSTSGQPRQRSPFSRAGWCHACRGPVPVFIGEDGPRLNPVFDPE